MEAGDQHVTRFRDCTVLLRGELVVGDVWVRGGKVIDPMKLFFRERRLPDRVLDCSGLLVAPGFIDLQVNGAVGIDFSSFIDATEAKRGLRKVAKHLLEHGVTSFCPTIITSHPDYYKKVLPAMKLAGHNEAATILGVHCEGPFLNQQKKGAHREEYIQDSLSQQNLLDCYGSLDNVRIVTLAPELHGAEESIRWLHDHDVVVSMGHSMAPLHTAEKAILAGASLITHLFNAMPPFHHRDPGIVGLLTSLEVGKQQVYYGMIADGNHTHVTAQRIAYHSNKSGAVLVTDAIAAMGLCEGVHSFDSMSVEIKENRAHIAGTNTLAGSVTSMDSCVRKFQKATACSSAEALTAASLHPAQVLGLDSRKGKLECGYDADMVILTEDLYPVATYIAGEVVWKHKDAPQPVLTS